MSVASFSRSPFLLSVCVSLLLSLAGCAPGANGKVVSLNTVVPADNLARLVSYPADALVFGFDRRLDLKEDVKMYLSFLSCLERKTGQRFRLHISPKDRSIVDELGSGEVDLAAIGTGSYLEAREKYGVRMLVRGLNAQGQGEYRSFVITRPGSPVRSLADLRGRTFAFGARTSTQGYLIPRIILAEAGVDLEDLKGYDHTYSHAETANAVISGKFDAGGVQDTLGQNLANRGLVRIIAASRYYPSSGIAVSRDVSPEVVAAVRQALLEFAPQGPDKDDLYHWELSEMPLGFATAQEPDYAELATWAKRFGLLP